MKKFDRVRLKPKFNNTTIYVIAEITKNRIVRLFPEADGYTRSAKRYNLELVG